MSKVFFSAALVMILVNAMTNLTAQTTNILFAKSKSPKNYTISGIIKDETSGETLPYATISVQGSNVGTVTNQFGFYSLTLSEGQYELSFRYVGFEEIQKNILLN